MCPHFNPANGNCSQCTITNPQKSSIIEHYCMSDEKWKECASNPSVSRKKVQSNNSVINSDFPFYTRQSDLGCLVPVVGVLLFIMVLAAFATEDSLGMIFGACIGIIIIAKIIDLIASLFMPRDPRDR